ncbi:GNAT family N-acetyltransferase [Leclercia adecarboxylata ATCC 23216 = NBRC 102595]|uniref:GNAT family N-acetyltransferase n=1 Tax=Leclercia sp. Marseille-Q4284 TaxID=2866582 RepID=UPI001CE41774|nr:GNAT family N-acetyltransferase [Leclercia sp. Marseille-Q4284]MCT9843763.1 GNAT family N-acetyltransferase [Leclercia adecarboxylata ATCC 23216 = NBRC 102595]
MTQNFEFIETHPSAEDFCRLREIAGLSPRNLEAAKKGLPASCYAVHVRHEGIPVGMGRVVGDGALNFEIVDIAVDPNFQGKGLGRAIMEHIMDWLGKNAWDGTYISLVADVPALYEKFGFENVTPACEGMAISWKNEQ